MTEVREIMAKAIHEAVEVGRWEDFVDEAGSILTAFEAAGYVVVKRFDEAEFMRWFENIPTEPTPALRAAYEQYKRVVVNGCLPPDPTNPLREGEL